MGIGYLELEFEGVSRTRRSVLVTVLINLLSVVLLKRPRGKR